MKRFRFAVLLVLLAALLLSATPVYADTPDPDSTPTIVSFNLYRNLRQPGDWLLVIYANIPYSTPPDTTVTQTFIWRLMDPDNVTVLGSTVGTNYNTDGYGYNVYSMYWSASEVTGFGMAWETIYGVRLSGNPVVFDTPPTYNFDLDVSDYSTLTVQADVQAELTARILTIASDLDNKWGLLYSLLTQNETATVLSTYGEAFFRGTIHGLQAMAPTVFSVIIRAIDIDPRDWDTEYAENVTSQWEGTWIETSQEAGKVMFGTDYDLLSIIVLLIMGVGLMIGNVMLTGDFWNGAVDIALLGTVGARLGMFDLAFLILIAALCWIYIGLKVWFGMIK